MTKAMPAVFFGHGFDGGSYLNGHRADRVKSNLDGELSSTLPRVLLTMSGLAIVQELHQGSGARLTTRGTIQLF